MSGPMLILLNNIFSYNVLKFLYVYEDELICNYTRHTNSYPFRSFNAFATNCLI